MTEPETPSATVPPPILRPAYAPDVTSPPVVPPNIPGQPGPPYVPARPGPPYAAFPPRPVPVAPGGVPLADPGTRLLAYIIDSVLLMFVNFIPVIVAIALLFGRFHDAMTNMQHANEVAIAHSQALDTWPLLRHLFRLELIVFAIVVPFTLLFSYLYCVEFSYRNGQTVGKKIMGIKVVRAADSGPVTKLIMVRRWLVSHVASLFAPYFSYADSLWLLWDKPYQQCLHDKCADTVVVKSRP